MRDQRVIKADATLIGILPFSEQARPLNGVEAVDIDAILQDGYYSLARDRTMPKDRTPITWANKPLLLLVHLPD